MEAITRSRAQGPCQRPCKSIPLHLGGPSEVFVELSPCPGVPRSSTLVSPGNEWEETGHQDNPLLNLTFVFITSDTLLIAKECGRPCHPPKGIPGSWEHCYSHATVRQGGQDLCKSPKIAHSIGAGRLLPNIACTPGSFVPSAKREEQSVRETLMIPSRLLQLDITHIVS